MNRLARLRRKRQLKRELGEERRHFRRLISAALDEETYNASPEEYDAYMAPFRGPIREEEEHIRQLEEELTRL